jgi:hypothetical protein
VLPLNDGVEQVGATPDPGVIRGERGLSTGSYSRPGRKSLHPSIDPAYQLGGREHGTELTRARATEIYGLDDPLPEQYRRLMKGILTGETSCFYGCGSVRTAFLDALPVTLSLVLGAAATATSSSTGR